jgi:hypothetical protein
MFSGYQYIRLSGGEYQEIRTTGSRKVLMFAFPDTLVL